MRKIQGGYAAHKLGIPDSNTGAYCKARRRLDPAKLRAVHQHTAQGLQAHVSQQQLWCGRPVKVVDGTGVSMPDTPENQKVFPQSSGQKPGCGFPVAKLVGCFCLSSGALIDWVEGTLKNHEYALFRTMWNLFEKGDVVLTDRGFCAFEAIARLLRRGVDSVMRLHQARYADFRRGKRISKNEKLVHW